MNDRGMKIVIGALLHDIGKVIYRSDHIKMGHSKRGCEYLDSLKIDQLEQEILECVSYHHAKELSQAKLEEDSIAYIVYIADNIAAAADRRKKDDGDYGFDSSQALESVFGNLNGNSKKLYYKPQMLDLENNINFPSSVQQPFEDSFYIQVKTQLTNNLRAIELSPRYLNSLLSVLESCLSYVPSSTAKHEYADISLYDHLKITAAIASCIYQYSEANDIKNYQQTYYEQSKAFYEKKAFRIFSMDISGIQKFIYTITSKNALKMLRARSFYLELIMEHLVDCLLERLNLSRANLLYAGGGHCYILLPNTNEAEASIETYLLEMNRWLMKKFGHSLYIAGDSVPVSSLDLKNEPTGSYSKIFQNLSKKISRKKLQRYSAEDLRLLNKQHKGDHSRECNVCKSLDDIQESNRCYTCEQLVKFSNQLVQHQENNAFFSIMSGDSSEALLLPDKYYLMVDDEKSLKRRMSDPNYVRSYSINKAYTGVDMTTTLYVGSYTSGDNFEEMAKKSRGIDRIGIIRADVDNMGQAFVSGFHDQLASISRTAALSHHLSLFFKLYLNYFLKHYTLPDKDSDAYQLYKLLIQDNYVQEREENRNVAIVYSGGDDLFIVGAWNEIIMVAIDIQKKFAAYVDQTMTLSAGIGIYPHKYPISVIADEVAELEDASKSMPNKNAITLLPDDKFHLEQTDEGVIEIPDATYSWYEFIEGVLLDKLELLETFLQSEDSEKGKTFLYQVLMLLRNRTEKINFARFVYLLSRLEPTQKDDHEKKHKFEIFKRKMGEYYHQESDARQLKTACAIYAYKQRESEE